MFQVNPLLHMKNQAIISSKDKSKKLKCRLLQFLFGALRVHSTVMKSKDLYGLENSVDPNQTAPRGAVRSGSALFSQTCLSHYFEFLWYH